MKRFLLIKLSICLMTFSMLTACNKEYNCTCEWESQLPPPNPPHDAGTDVIPLGKMSESEAKDSCNAWNVLYEENNYYTSSSCKL